jgi:hypothetical protein
MNVIIIMLITISAILSGGLIYCIGVIYIHKKEIHILKQQQTLHADDIKNIIISQMSLITSIREAAESQAIAKIISNTKTIGEA